MSSYASRDAFIFRNTVVPSNVHHFVKGDGQQNWTAVTWDAIHAERTRKQRSNEFDKRRITEKKPCCIWVFYNDTYFFSGWYIYIVTIKNDWGINFRSGINKAMIIKAMEMYPCGVIPIYDNFELWCRAFCERYPSNGFKKYGGKSSKYRPHQGLVKCHCLVQGSKLIDITF